MSTKTRSKDEEEQVTKFLLKNSKFLENYLIEHTSIPFLKDVSSHIASTTYKTELIDRDQPDALSDGRTIDDTSLSENSNTKQTKKAGKSCLPSEISITICYDPKEVSKESSENSELETITDKAGDYLQKIEEEEKASKDEEGCPSSPSVVPRTARKSITSDLFQQWLQNGTAKLDPTKTPHSQASLSAGGSPFSSPPLGPLSPSTLIGKDMELLEQNDRLMDLILDISNELDINILCHKILLNVGHLTKADRCSLFLARGPRDQRYLEAKLFDVDVNTSKCYRVILSIIPEILESYISMIMRQ